MVAARIEQRSGRAARLLTILAILAWLPACRSGDAGGVDATTTQSASAAGEAHRFSDTTPRFVPTGDGVVFVREEDGDSDIYIMSLPDGEPTVLADISEYDLDPAVSPDGGEVVFESSPAGFAQLHLIRVDDGDLTAISEVGDGWATFPAWSPTGKEIVYSCGRPLYERSDLCVLSRSGAFLGLPEGGSESQELEPSWSPDGTTVAFASNRSGDFEVYLIDLESESVTRLTHSESHDVDPAWSPDGSRIAFTSDRNGRPQACVMQRDGRQVRCLADGVQPSWSPDGRSLAYYADTPDGSRIFITDVEGERTEQIT